VNSWIFRSTECLEEMKWFLWDEYEVMVYESTIHRFLTINNWSKKQVHIMLVTLRYDISTVPFHEHELNILGSKTCF